MRCPYCRQDIRVSGRFCPRCGRQIFGLPVTNQQPAAPGAWPPQGTTQPAPAAPTPTQASAGPGTVGKTCPYDQYPISVGDQVVVCPECGVPHHVDCWRENGGCTTYGCARSPQSRTAAAAQAAADTRATQVAYPYPGPVGTPSPFDTPPALVVLTAEAERRATNALLMSIMGIACCPVISIVGFFMGVSAFGALSQTGIKAPGARMKATWAIIIGALVPVGWACVMLAFSGDAHRY